MGKRARIRWDARVFGGTFERGTEVIIVGEDSRGSYQVRDDFGNRGSVEYNNVEFI